MSASMHIHNVQTTGVALVNGKTVTLIEVSAPLNTSSVCFVLTSLEISGQAFLPVFSCCLKARDYTRDESICVPSVVYAKFID